MQSPLLPLWWKSQAIDLSTNGFVINTLSMISLLTGASKTTSVSRQSCINLRKCWHLFIVQNFNVGNVLLFTLFGYLEFNQIFFYLTLVANVTICKLLWKIPDIVHDCPNKWNEYIETGMFYFRVMIFCAVTTQIHYVKCLSL